MGSIGIAAFIVSFVFFQILKSSSPTFPVSAAQQVYQMNSHGYLFYVTRENYWIHYSLLYGGWSMGFLTALLNYRWKVIHNLTLEGWKLPK